MTRTKDTGSFKYFRTYVATKQTPLQYSSEGHVLLFFFASNNILNRTKNVYSMSLPCLYFLILLQPLEISLLNATETQVFQHTPTTPPECIQTHTLNTVSLQQSQDFY